MGVQLVSVEGTKVKKIEMTIALELYLITISYSLS